MASQPNKIKFLASACLAGIKCTYNAGSNLIPAVRKDFLGGNCLLVCPEVMGGLPTPRKPMEIAGGDGLDVLLNKARVVDSSGRDVTKKCLKGALKAVRLAIKYKIKKAVLKTKSPCCGVNGILTSALIRRGIKVYTEKDLKICMRRW